MEGVGARVRVTVLVGIALLTASLVTAGAGAGSHDSGGPSYGTLVAEDPAGDTRGPTPWLDVRELWFDSNGVNLTITLVLQDLRENQPLDSYEVAFLNDRNNDTGLFTSGKDSLECDLGSMEPERSECRYIYKHPEEGNEFREVAFQVDPDTDTIQATIPYRYLHAEPGERLRAIEVTSHYDAEGPLGGAQVAEDSAKATDPYELAEGPEEMEPFPEPLVAWDPRGDTTTGLEWLDLRRLTLASDGERLNVTLEVGDLREDQRADRYDVRFTDGSEPSTSPYPGVAPVDHDELNCEVGEGPLEGPGCEYTRRDEGGKRTSKTVPVDVDLDADTITATVSYDLIGLDPGGKLDVLRAVSWVHVGGSSIGADTMTVERTYRLVGDEPEPDPEPERGPPMATDPQGDTSTGNRWLDLRTLWVASDGERMNVTLELEDLHEGQYADRYEVRLTDSSEPGPSPLPVVDQIQYDELSCDVSDSLREDPGCEYTRRNDEDSQPAQSVPMDVDLAGDTLTASVPYDRLGLEAGDELEVLEAVSWMEVENTSRSEDRMEVRSTHTLE